MDAVDSKSAKGDKVSTSETSEVATPSRPRKWPRRLLMLLVCGACALAWVAPQLAGRMLVQNGWMVSGNNQQTVRIDLGGASLGWLSPVIFSDVIVHDLEGQPFVRVASVTSERPLWQLVTDRTKPGRFIVREPIIDVVVREQGSNAADVIRAFSDVKGPESLSSVAVTVERAQLHLTDVDGTELVHLENLSLDASDDRTAQRHLMFEMTADTVRAEERLPVEAAFEWTGSLTADPVRSGKGTAAVKFAPLPLSALVTRLHQWIPDLDLHRGDVAGEVLAEWDFDASQKARAKGTLTATNVLAHIASAPEGAQEIDWPSEVIAFDIEGDYSTETDSLLLSKATLQSSPVTLNANGGITDLQGACELDIRGELRYDLDQFVQNLAADYREHVQVRGLQTREFSIRGPLVTQVDGVSTYDLSQVALEADLGWEQADVFGVHSEEATLVTRLIGGVLEIEPRNVPVSGGQFRGNPQVDLHARPTQAEMKEGLVLENIQLSPEMCHLWMKYLSPPLAEATRAEGRFSIALSDTQLPLDNLASGELQGVLNVHSAEIRPGPFANQIIGLISVIEGMVSGRRNVSAAAGDVWITMPEQEIEFHLANGRMHHASLVFMAGPVTIRSSGSVGLDETLDLMIAVTLPDEWLSRPILSDLFEGEIIRIPVVGTFDRPQFDRRGIADFGKRIAARATGGLLRRLLDN
ncbi:MAG: hypothetical protein R3B91_22900 [Planctomycetaceae bacterium]